MIDKRLFLTATTCPTQAWYDLHAPKQPPTPDLEWLFYAGNEVQELARRQLGAGTMLPRTFDAGAIDRTRAALGTPGSDLLFEASFTWNRCAARADALRRTEGGWELIEIKASKAPEEGKKPKPDQVDDIAYTTMVCRGAGVPLTRCILMLINRGYREGNGAPLMVEVDATEQVIARADEFAALAPALAEAVLGEERPEPVPILACRKCDYFATTCLGKEIAHPVFQIPYLTEKSWRTIEPELDLMALPADLPLTDRQRPAFEAIRSGVPVVNPGALARLDDVIWPAYYLDFETVAPALPWFAGDGAYDTIPFQYSLHIADAPDQVVSHHEYLAPLDGDWRVELLEQMLDALGAEGSIIVYTSFEQKRLEELQARHPEYAGRIARVIDRLFDLEEVVRLGYTHPGFGGRTSIKKVLPVLVPELSYAGLTIADGSAASAIFGLSRVGVYQREWWPGHRANLLTYCKLDTEAMVRVHAELEKRRVGR